MAKKSNKGAADDIALMASSGLGTDLNAWLNQQGIGADDTLVAEPARAQVAPTSEPRVEEKPGEDASNTATRASFFDGSKVLKSRRT
jgi:hypothetical protein